MQAGLYVGYRDGAPVCTWIPSEDTRTALVADLNQDTCNIVVATPELINDSSCLISFKDERAFPYRPGSAFEELSCLFEDYLLYPTTTFEIAALVGAVLRGDTDKNPLIESELDCPENSTVVSALVAPFAEDVASCKECSSKVKWAVEDLLQCAWDGPVDNEWAYEQPINFSYGAFRIAANVCLNSLRLDNTFEPFEPFEVLEGSSGYFDESGAERWFNNGVEVTSQRDSMVGFNDLDDANNQLFAFGTTAAAAACCPNLTAEDLSCTVSRALDIIEKREQRSTWKVRI